MTAEADFFLRIGFLEMKEDEWDNRLGRGDVFPTDSVVLLCVCKGPYSQVTSQSFSQFSVSGDTVFKRFFVFVHDLHEAFSKRVPLVRPFRLCVT